MQVQQNLASIYSALAKKNLFVFTVHGQKKPGLHHHVAPADVIRYCILAFSYIVLDGLMQAAARNTVAGPSPLQMSSLQYPLLTLSPDHFSSALDMQHVRIKATASRPRRAQTQFPVCKKNIRMEVN